MKTKSCLADRIVIAIFHSLIFFRAAFPANEEHQEPITLVAPGQRKQLIIVFGMTAAFLLTLISLVIVVCLNT